jgi:predicted enzyme related to lactoylglutathione lyase
MLGPLSWVLVYTADIPRMRAFYEQVLGLKIKRASEKIVAFDTGACTLELMGRMDNGPDRMDESRGWRRNKVLVSFHVADIKAEVAAIEARGAPCLTGIRPTVSPAGQPPKGWIAQFEDPDGNLIELCEEPLEA